jgi:hypothetical protein
MNTKPATIEMHGNQLDQLQVLLEKQIKMVKNSDFNAVEILAAQADSLVSEIAQTQPSQQSQWKEKYGDLIQLYQKLELMIETEKDTVNKQLLKVGSGKKTVRAYHHKT